MKLQVKQWGNSQAVRLPKDFISAFGLHTGDFLELSNSYDDKIILTIRKNEPSVKRKRLTLDERLANSARNGNEFTRLEEWETISPVGQELF